MEKLLVFTDLHIKDGTIIGLDPAARFKAALKHAMIDHADAQGIVLMGDLAHGETVSEYNILKSILADVGLPVSFMMGNHDRRDVFLQVFPKAALDGAGFVQSAFDIGNWRGLTLDTLDGPPYPKGLHSGRLCDDRLQWLSEQLQRAQDKPIALFTHHPLGDIGFPMMDCIKLGNGAVIVDILRKHPMPVHVLSGHVHRTISGQWNGISYTVFKSPCHQNPLNLVEKYASMSVDEPGAYGVLLFDGPNIIVHSEDYAIAQRYGLSDTLS